MEKINTLKRLEKKGKEKGSRREKRNPVRD
jgi:hypothetical protein